MGVLQVARGTEESASVREEEEDCTYVERDLELVLNEESRGRGTLFITTE